ncbi:MAG: serine/threonine protein kinase, partial [Thermoleophilaceae bacterium]|nr:serine/threonine protein kinase [Thermoleophilaceae bacterium]
MSTVYRAFDETLERWVAIKVLHREMSGEADQLERFRREARAVARLSSPNLVSVIDAGDDEGHPYIVFELVDGETLKDRIRRERLPVDEAIAYAIEIGRALVVAHEAQLVHRDVKPQNVLVDKEGRAKVTDFGIARSLEADGLTMTGRVLGTTDYVSPEQALGHSVTEQSDVYSLGIVLFEMLTGDVPFKADTQVGVAMKHVRDPLPNVQMRRPEVSSTLAAVVERATAKETRHRYRTVDETVHDLEQALAIEAARAGSTTGGEATSVLRQLPRESGTYAPARLRRPARWLAT